MKVVEDGRAPNPRRVRIFLAEKGIQMEYEQVDINASDHKTPEFALLNPLQRVPVLVLDDGTTLSESMAICRYFEEVQPEPPLLGKDALDKAMVEMWQRRMELNLMFPVAQTFRHLHPAMAEMEKPQVAGWGEVNRPRALTMLSLLDRELGNRPFIAGEDFTMADITALVAVDFMKPARIERPDNLKNLDRWHEQVSSRPSAKA
ncbi:MAG: glutathione S-transferase [Hyphomicrobiaceae bacterium]|nr:glutathione S-transferase [Hyphomicrobiaceae bacterium]